MMVVIQFCFASVPDLRPAGAEPILRPILSCIPRCVRGKRQAIILQKPSHFHGLKEQVSRVCGCLEASSDITANKHTARFPAGRPISPPNQRHPFYRPCHTPNILFTANMRPVHMHLCYNAFVRPLLMCGVEEGGAVGVTAQIY